MGQVKQTLPVDLDPDRFVSEWFLEERGIMPRKTSQGHRWKGTGPPYYKIGKSVRYRLGDVLAWLTAHRVEPRG